MWTMRSILLLVFGLFKVTTANSQSYYHNQFVLAGYLGGEIRNFQMLYNINDDGFVLDDFLAKYPKTFYLDTITKEMAYNTYNTNTATYSSKHPLDFHKMYSAGKLSIKNGTLTKTPQSLSNSSFRKFFKHKVPLGNLRKKYILLNLNELSQIYVDTTKSYFLDLNADQKKEKLTVQLKFDDEMPETIYLQRITLYFYKKNGNKWKLYDKVTLDNSLTGGIDEFIVFKTAEKGNANIFINSVFGTISGFTIQSQVLLMGSKINRTKMFTM